MRGKFAKLFLLPALVAVLLPQSAFACSACYGDPNSAMANGLTWAITALVAVVALVLAGVVAFFVRAAKHAEVVTDAPPPDEFLLK